MDEDAALAAGRTAGLATAVIGSALLAAPATVGLVALTFVDGAAAEALHDARR